MQRGVGGGQIDQVGAVGHGRSDCRSLKIRAEAVDLFGGQGPGPPLVATFGEKLDGPTANLLAPQWRQIDPSRDRHMGAEEQVGLSKLLRFLCHYW
jgi:hypothetical protein